MELNVSPAAVAWFKNEMALQDGDNVKFVARYGGSSPVQSGFSLGYTVNEAPDQIGISRETQGILFFIEERDLWFLDGHDLFVDFNKSIEELEFSYKKK